jgi:hypothetical protein
MFMSNVRSNDKMKLAKAKEFEKLVSIIIKINLETEKAFHGTATITVKRFVRSLVQSADVTSNIPDE